MPDSNVKPTAEFRQAQPPLWLNFRFGFLLNEPVKLKRGLGMYSGDTISNEAFNVPSHLIINQ